MAKQPPKYSDGVEDSLHVIEGGLDKSSSLVKRQRLESKERRQQALSLLMAGFSFEQIGERLSIAEGTVKNLVEKILSRVVNEAADEMRALENARLDRAQTAIWTKVIAGDLPSIETFLRISTRRAKMNGLDEPTKVNLSINVRQEMEQALVALESVV